MPEVTIFDIWLPILVSATFVFIVSSVIHMATPMHKGDKVKLPDEDAVLAAMRAAGVSPGDYFFPHAGSMKEMADPEFVKKQELGPVGFATILPNGPMKMGMQLVIWFVYSAVIALFAGYVATISLGSGADYSSVFRVTGTVAVLGFCVPQVENSVWRGISWPVTGRFMIDGLIYGLVTAGAFGWLWPAG